MNLDFYRTVSRLLRAGRTLAVATLVEQSGSTPRHHGAKMVVTESGATEFSIGGGAFEALVIGDALEALRAGRGGEKTYRFAEQGADALGMVCGGTARVLFEVVRPPRALLVFGAGHVGRELARQAMRLGFDVTLIDDRPHLLEAKRHPRGVRTVTVGHDFGDGLPEVPRGACVAIVTRCHRTDLAVVRHAVGRGAQYVGLIGSRRKVAVLKKRAEEAGVPRTSLAELHAPIGLAIGAETPEEIAVSIAAELIAVHRSSRAAGRKGEVTPIRSRRAPIRSV